MNESEQNKQPEQTRRGPPYIEIDWKKFDALCRIHCTLEEIAYIFGCSEDTIERACEREKNAKFAEYYKSRATGGRVSLRRKMWEAADKGNITMMIFLSKQPELRGGLGFSDKVTSEHNLSDGSYEKMLAVCKELEAEKKAEG